ncbi:MAG: hypothetical protein ACRCZP_17650 [Phycicoccus sp.]
MTIPADPVAGPWLRGRLTLTGIPDDTVQAWPLARWLDTVTALWVEWTGRPAADALPALHERLDLAAEAADRAAANRGAARRRVDGHGAPAWGTSSTGQAAIRAVTGLLGPSAAEEVG